MRSGSQRFLLIALVLLLPLAAIGQTPEDSSPPAVENLFEGASEDQQASAIEAAGRWMDNDFSNAYPIVLDWAADERIPIAVRAALLRDAFEPARTQTAPEFDARSAELYDSLIEALPAGIDRSQLHQAHGNLMVSRGQFETAETLYRASAAEDQGRETGERANLRSALGVSLAQQGKLDQALEAMLRSFELYELTEDGPSSTLLRNIGGLSIYLENWEQSIRFSILAIEKIGANNPAALGVYSNLAAAQVEQGQLDDALETLNAAMVLSEASNQQNSPVLSNLGYVLRELGRPEEALARYLQSAELDRARNDTAALGISLKNIGETQIELGRREDAADSLRQSLETYREADIKPKRLELYPVMVDNLEQLGRYAEALALMREYRGLDQELASTEAQTRVAELQSAFDLERRERELADSERERLAREMELEQLQSDQAHQRLERLALIAGLVTLALLLILALRLLGLRNRANRLLAEKNTEIEVQRHALTETNAKLQRYSIEDELTGLHNRRYIRQLLKAEKDSPLRRARSLMVLIDLDRFKGINDRFGHPVGDAVLETFAEVLRSVAGSDDVLIRWGGEEFLWLAAD
ncbi:MAG: diguanylate cyclase, partial [Pseudomonadota bacterium]